jgi:hypothetical protein
MAYEDLTAFDEVNGDQLTVTSTTATAVDVADAAILSDNYGAGYFGATFEHHIRVTIGSDTFQGMDYPANVWVVANSVDGMESWGSETLELQAWQNDDDAYLKIIERDGDTSDTSIALSVDTVYYLKIVRTSSTALEVRIYSNEAMTTHVDTISVTIATTTYQYLCVFSAADWGGDPFLWSGVVSHVDIAPSGGTAHAASGAVAAVSSVTGVAEVAFSASGAVQATSSVTGTARVAYAVSGAVAAVSSVTGTASIGEDLAASGAVTAVSSVTGTATVAFAAAGAVAAVSSVTGAAGVAMPASGTVAGVSSVTGAAGLAFAVSGAVSAVSSVTGAAGVAFAAAGDVAGVSSVTGAATMAYAAAGAVAGVSSVSGRATNRLALDCADNGDGFCTLSFPSAGSDVVWLIADAVLLIETASGEALVESGLDARKDLSAIRYYSGLTGADLDELLPSITGDDVALSWNDVSADLQILSRKPAGGDYIELDRPSGTSYADADLADDTWTYRLDAYDEVGNVAASNEEEAVVNVGPAPPTGLSLAHDNGTKETTLTWTASVSADAAGYNLYTSALNGAVRLTGTPTDCGDVEVKVVDNTGVTGRLEWLLRTYNASGIEEAGIDAMVHIDLVNGERTLRPNTPTISSATAISAGQAEVQVAYTGEGAAGTATTVRIYADDGAGGAVDYVTPVCTIILGETSEPQARTGLTAGLDGQKTYALVARARTSAGTEDTNTTETEVTTDSLAPTTPTLAAVVS